MSVAAFCLLSCAAGLIGGQVFKDPRLADAAAMLMLFVGIAILVARETLP